ncbi:MAG: glycosyltransferase [Rudaea sp.]|nr:glycosyltransferase [Rudaea sp.]
MLVAYPGDPEAMHGLARCDLAEGRPDSALQWIVAAIDIDPANVEYRACASLIRQRLGNPPATGLSPGAASAPSVTMPPPSKDVLVAATPPLVSRTGPCPCGSSRRFKDCCGKLAGNPVAEAGASSSAGFLPAAAIFERAQSLLQAGEADKAAALLTQHLRPEKVANAGIAQAAGESCRQMHLLQPALDLLQRAIELSGGRQDAITAYDDCCHLLLRPLRWESASRTLRILLDRLSARADLSQASIAAPVHIVCKLDTIGRTERRALNLYRHLCGHAQVTLWSVTPALPLFSADFTIRQITRSDAPAGGTLVLIGTYFACGDWLEQAMFERVVICHNLSEQYPSLIERLIQIEQNPSCPAVALTFPSRLFKETIGLPGIVEYSPVDVEAFRRRAPRAAGSRLTIGRHGRAYGLKFHPNDPSFFRVLMRRGHKVRILGGSAIAMAFARDTAARPELLALGSEPAHDFLERLDLFVYRKHPAFFETGGTVILEAMAMELPVILFREHCGSVELIEHGRNGFLVDSEDEAIELIDRLAEDPGLRERVGRAARATIVDLMGNQGAAIVERYLGIAAGSTDQVPIRVAG